jgi:hypothetical protein
MTSREMLGISIGLHINMSLLSQKKSKSSFSNLGSRLAPICTVLVGSSTSICIALASSVAFQPPDVGGMAGLSGTVGT